MPNNDSLLAQAQLAAKQQNFDLARGHILSALRDDRNDARCWQLLLHVAHARNDLKEAALCLSELNRLNPTTVTLFDEALAHHKMQRADRVVAILATIDVEHIDDAELALNIGRLLTQYDQLDQAQSLFERAVHTWPENAEFRFELARQLLFSGEFQSSKDLLDALLASGAISGEVIKAYTELPRKYWRDDLVAVIDSAQVDARTEDLPHLHLAKYRVLETNKQYKEAFKALQSANELQLKLIRARRKLVKPQTNELISFYDRQPRNTSASVSSSGVTPIFLVGLPRSGTTLTEQIISAHSEIVGLGELPQFPNLIKRALSISERTNTQINWSLVGETYLKQVQNLIGSAKFFVDKMPLNYQLNGFIRLCLPQAKIVLIDRNPIDVCFSQYRQIFALDAAAMDHSYQLEDLAQYFGDYQRTVTQWKDRCGEALYSLKYEALVDDFEGSVRALMNYLGLDVEAECLSFERSRRRVSTASAGQVREGVNSRSVARWKHYERELGALIGGIAL